MGEIFGNGMNTKNQEEAIRNFMRGYLDKPKDKTTLKHILQDIGDYYDADRSYIFEMNGERTTLSNTYEWCREGIHAEIDNLQNISVDGLDCWFDAFHEKGEFFITSLSEDYVPDSKTYQILEPQGIESLMAASIVAEGEIVGFLGIDNPRRHTEDLLLLSVAASTCYSEIATERLLDSKAEQEYLSIIRSLSSVFFAMFLINLEKNMIQELISLDNMNYMFGEKGEARTVLKNMTEILSDGAHLPIMRVFTDFDTMDERLGKKKILVQEFLTRTREWNRCSLIPVERDANGRNIKVLLGLRQITKEKETLESQDNLIQALAIPYENIYTVNADTCESICYRMGQVMQDRYGEKFAVGNYEENISSYVDNDVFEEDRPLFSKLRSVSDILQLLKDKKTYSFNYRVFRNHQIHYFECQLVKPNPVRNEFVIGFKNTDEKIRRQLKQIHEMEMQREIIEGIGSEYYSVLLVNPETDSATVYRAQDEDGRAIAEYFHKYHYCWSKTIESYADEMLSDASRDEFLEKLSLEHIRADGKDYSFIYEKVTEDVITYLQVRVSFVRETGGGFAVVVGTRNVDELIKKERQQETALQAAFDAAEAASKAKTDFLSNMSHDIRTPMNGIIGMTAIAAAHIHDKERVQDSLQKITQASKHLLSLINEVLDMSKIESGKVDLVEEEFNLSELIDNLLTMTSAQIEAHHHELSVNISGVTHEAVVGDSLRIQKVFMNLMSNAVKYTPDGGKISLSISEKPCCQPKVGCFEFIFEDNGIGIEEDFLNHIFEPFSRAERTSNIQGTGLGMPISRNIVRMMGGDIKVESRQGEGSRFIVTMYLKLQDTSEVSYDKFIDLHVLVADDDDLSLESCCGMLTDLGMKAEGVSTGREAVRQVVWHHEQNNDYFACIIDWKIQDMDGIETTRAIRRKVGADVPIIIISAYDWSDIEQEARAAGANAFISKPLFRSRLERTFNVLLGQEEEKEPDTPLDSLTEMDFSKYRALLVEDNELNAEIATEILKTTGLLVDHAVDGIEAVDRMVQCEDGYYDIVFMDIQMPRMNGYDATRAIRAMHRNYCRQVPIVAMTANAFAEDVQAAKTVGMNEHIAKPLDLRILARTLRRWLSKE